jgi:HEPN domain-containing protein
VNRTELQKLAEDRILDAQALLTAGRWAAAYYLTGYAVECALKACIAKLTREHDFPRDRRFVEKCYTHDLDKLLDSAGLKPQQEADSVVNLDFGANWQTVTDWSENSRYDQKTQVEAEQLLVAVTDIQNGVMPWIKNCW